MRPHHRPSQPGAAFFEAFGGGADPAEVREAGDLAAAVLVRGARRSGDPAIAERVLRLADTEGLETLAEVWSGAPADTLAGCLWRLYLLRDWVHRSPRAIADEYAAGRHHAQVASVLAGVADPPGPDELTAMVDDVLRGVAIGDFAVTLLRAAAFARVVATGRAVRAGDAPDESSPDAHGEMLGDVHQRTIRLLALAETLERAGHAELSGELD